jgi:predicted nucleotidyltransferase
MRWTQQQSLEATLLYSSLFQYPLTKEEVQRYAIMPYDQPPHVYRSKLLNKYTHKNYILLPEHHHHSHIRNKREVSSMKKWKIVNKHQPFFAMFPTIKMIGISGSLSMNNADKDDDIDLFIICAAGSIWITRLYIILLLTILRKRRAFGSVGQKDLFCPNMFVTTETLAVPQAERDLYTAHEIVQLQCVWSLGQTYKYFLHKNKWIRHILPHAYAAVYTKACVSVKETQVRKYAEKLAMLIERPAKYIQLWYMKHHITSEVISDSILKFHPHDNRSAIRNKFSLLLQQKNIPLDSRFF